MEDRDRHVRSTVASLVWGVHAFTMNRLTQGIACAVWVLLLGGGFCACGDDSAAQEDLSSKTDMAVPLPHNFAQIDNLLLQPACASFSVCHSKAGKNLSHVDLCSAADPAGATQQICDPGSTLDSAYVALFEQPATNAKAKGEGLLLVKPCDPDNSFLIKKLELPASQLDPKIGYGGHMPSGSPPLAPEQIKAIRDWIARGAHRDEPADVSGTTCTSSADGGA